MVYDSPQDLCALRRNVVLPFVRRMVLVFAIVGILRWVTYRAPDRDFAKSIADLRTRSLPSACRRDTRMHVAGTCHKETGPCGHPWVPSRPRVPAGCAGHDHFRQISAFVQFVQGCNDYVYLSVAKVISKPRQSFRNGSRIRRV